MTAKQRVLQSFGERFAHPPRYLVRAPGRINLIGEHTDYNDGFVLPMAIDRAAWIALEPSDDGLVTLYAADFGQEVTFALGEAMAPGEGWDGYVRGVAWALRGDGLETAGWRGVMGGDVPIGSGLSSSAALELAVARAFAAVTPFDWDPIRMARLAQRAESGWVGVNCGLMDQLAAAAGEAGHALFIDCRTLDSQAIPLPDSVAFLVLDSAAPRTLAGSAYNLRRAECESAVARLAIDHPEVRALRDVSSEMLEREACKLTPVELRRTRHIVSENERVLQSVEALRAGDVRRLGELMTCSHESLRVDYEVSSVELDALVRLALGTRGVLGARLTGAGFGGCAVAAVEVAAAADAAVSIMSAYRSQTGRAGQAFISAASPGATLEPI